MNKWVGVCGVVLLLMSGCGGGRLKQQAIVAALDQRIDSLNRLLESRVQAMAEDNGGLPALGRLDSVVLLSTRDSADGLFAAQQSYQRQWHSGISAEADQATTMHYDHRRPNFVIIHHTSQHSTAQTVRTFQLAHTKVSAHYVIGRDGRVIQMLNDYDRAWHAGSGRWGNVSDLNSVSLGIELDNDGFEPFPPAQIQALLNLLDRLKRKYYIPQTNFIGHGDIAPGRKNDPHAGFPWKLLAEHGFGIWYNEDYLPSPAAGFNASDALKIMGYDMRKPKSAIAAFKRKFMQVEDSSGELSAKDIAVLYDLYRKYY